MTLLIGQLPPIKRSLYNKSKIYIGLCSKGIPPPPIPTHLFFLSAKASFIFIINMFFPQHYPNKCIRNIMIEISERIAKHAQGYFIFPLFRPSSILHAPAHNSFHPYTSTKPFVSFSPFLSQHAPLSS